MGREEASLVGEVLGKRYRLVRRLGQGGMGAVYEAVQEDLGRKVAIKVLHASLADDAQAIARFRREAEAAAGLGHPNIVQVTDFGRDERHGAFLVMELLAGRSLASAIAAEAPFDDARVAKIASQVLHGLAAAHAAGIVHRDLKPDNVFLVDVPGVGEVVKLLDFGIAKLRETAGDAEKLTSTGAVMGTPAYMAPEQARGRKVDERTDLYALGVCMYEALTGKMPFRGSSYNELLFAITEDTPPAMSTLREGIDARVAGVVQRAMEKDVARRFASADEMLAALGEKKARAPAKVDDERANAPTVASGPSARVTTGANEAGGRSAGRVIGALGVVAAVALAAWAGSRYASPPSPPARSIVSAPPSSLAPPPSMAPFVPPPSSVAPPVPVPEPADPAPPTHVRLGRVYLADYDQHAPALPTEEGINTPAVRACAVDTTYSDDYGVWRLVVANGRVRQVVRLAADPLNARAEACLRTALHTVHVPPGTPDGPWDISLSYLPNDSMARVGR